MHALQYLDCNLINKDRAHRQKFRLTGRQSASQTTNNNYARRIIHTPSAVHATMQIQLITAWAAKTSPCAGSVGA